MRAGGLALGPQNAGALQMLNPEPLAFTHEKDTVAVRHWPNEVAGEAEHRCLVRGAVADDERPRTIGETIEHPAQRGSQGGGVLVA